MSAGETFGWAADPDAGKLIEQYRSAGRTVPVSDPRIDVLIDLGILLGTHHSELYYEQEKMLISRAVSQDYTQYTVHVDDGLVFSVLYADDDMELGEYLIGAWVHRLAALSKGLRRGRKSLTGSTA